MADTAAQLEWEARRKPRAAIAALIAAFGVVLIGWHPFPDINPLDTPGILVQTTLSGGPAAGLLPAIEGALEPGPAGERPSAKVARYAYLSDNMGSVLLLALGCTVVLVAAALTLCFLAGATRFRRAQLSPLAFYAVIAGALLIAAANLLFVLAIKGYTADIVAAKPTIAGLDDIKPGAGANIGTFMAMIGRVMLAGAWILIALNAMRAGLLTRFMGALGIIAGVLMILPLGPMPLVIMFWLLSLSLLLAGRWPGGTPPAWATGTAMAWELPPARAARARDQADRAAAKEAKAPKAAKTPREPAGIAHPASKKKKRKRRD